MNIDELCQLFPEIPQSLRGEPFLAEYAGALGPLLRQAQKPTNCAGDKYAAGQLIYNKLIMPMDILNIGLTTPAKVIEELSGYLAQYRADPDGFVALIIPETAPSTPGGCQGE